MINNRGPKIDPCGTPQLTAGTPERGGAQGGPRPPCPFSRGAKVPFYKICLFKNDLNEQTLA